MIDAKKISILLVDPDPTVRRIVRQGLLPEGYLVLDIPNTDEAMKTSKDVVFDLLIADAFLPFIQKLANWMAIFNPRQKVLFLSEYAPSTVTGFGVCPPGCDILRKPFPGDVLKGRVRTALISNRPWRQAAFDAHDPAGSGSETQDRDRKRSLGLSEAN
jgi:DNA-binding response OmpR family regulator